MRFFNNEGKAHGCLAYLSNLKPICAVDCFFEIFTHLFLPFLSKLTFTSEFPDLLLSTLSFYCQSSGNNELLAEIREPVSQNNASVFPYFVLKGSSNFSDQFQIQKKKNDTVF